VANLQWTDLEVDGELLKVRVRKAKNDQKALGRDTFVDFKEGSQVREACEKWRQSSKHSNKWVIIFFTA
jgi:hypothetical protein